MRTKEAGKVAVKLIAEVERLIESVDSATEADAIANLKALLPEAKRAAHALTHRFP